MPSEDLCRHTVARLTTTVTASTITSTTTTIPVARTALKEMYFVVGKHADNPSDQVHILVVRICRCHHSRSRRLICDTTYIYIYIPSPSPSPPPLPCVCPPRTSAIQQVEPVATSKDDDAAAKEGCSRANLQRGRGTGEGRRARATTRTGALLFAGMRMKERQFVPDPYGRVRVVSVVACVRACVRALGVVVFPPAGAGEL